MPAWLMGEAGKSLYISGHKRPWMGTCPGLAGSLPFPSLWKRPDHWLKRSFRSPDPWSHDTLFGGLLQYGRSMWQKRTVYFPVAMKQKEKQPGSRYPNQGHAPNNLTFLHWVPTPVGASSSPLSHRQGTKPSTHSLWGLWKFKLLQV